MKNWWLDELAHAGPEHLDPEYVAGYERKSGYDPGPDVDALRRHGLGADSVVVDLGAGTGAFALAAAAVCRHVVAVDVSPAMREVLWGRVVALDVGNVDVVDGGLVSYEHGGEPPGFVFTRNALHQVPDFWQAIALTRIARLLGPGGILRLHDLIFDFDPADADAAIEAWLAGAVIDPAAGYTADELAAHVKSEFSTYRWLFEPMLERAGFTILERSYRRAAYGAYTCVVRQPR